jgi:cytoskeleton protein RodZ
VSGFGAKLREARESQGLTLETVEKETQIRKLYLTALEEENFAILPPQVYSIGFVRRYASFLKLDANDLSQEFKHIAYPVVFEEKVQQQPEKSRQSLNLKRLPLKNIILAAVFLLLVIWAGNYIVGYFGNNMSRPNPTNIPKVQNPAKNPSTSIPQKNTANSQLKLQLKVKTGQSCWILVKTDGEKKLEAILSDGQQHTFTADDNIYIKLGNAGAVDLYLNNKKIESLGGLGEVAEKEFKKSDK